MSDTVILGKRENSAPSFEYLSEGAGNQKDIIPTYESLEMGLNQAGRLVEDIVLKKYLYQLTELDIVPLDDKLKRIEDIRLFKITEMVYQNNEYSTYKFATVFNAVQNLNCGVFFVMDSDGQKTDFYMGVRSLDDKRTTKSLKDTLRNALSGQFPGVKAQDLLDQEAEAFLNKIPSKNMVSVSGIANNKDKHFTDNNTFIQGLEKLALAIQGQVYTAIVLARSIPSEHLDQARQSYESIYTQLSPFTNMQMTYGKNEALSVSKAFSKGTTLTNSHSTSTSIQTGTSSSKTSSESYSTIKSDPLGTAIKTVGAAALGIASLITAPMTGGASLIAAASIGAAQIGLSAYNPKATTSGYSTSETHSENRSETRGETNSSGESISENETNTKGFTTGSTNTLQLNVKNKSLLNTLEKIDLQLKRINECESVGMWECAAYFLSDSQETVEMAAGTYRALIKGENSGVETSALNHWGRKKPKELSLLREYVTNFLHPVFYYHSDAVHIPVTPASLVSSNELAIQMGLPRKSVCGFPVIEHADFGKEVVSYNKNNTFKQFNIGKIFNMGREMRTDVNIDRDSLTMHTFITGSTGSGKSNTIYEMLYQLRNVYNIPFMVVEPAKGEYKNIFGKFSDVTVYGSNPQKMKLLKINPFRFPEEIHVLEHLDRLVEIFNVCWPMYAAMPAILKEAMERAYSSSGWELTRSENRKGNKYPNFTDLLIEIEHVIKESKYSADSKGDYSGALLTRVRSLTNGLNGMIFCNDDLVEEELFDKNVIVDLSRIGSTETKSLIMGLLVMKLNEYRMSSGKINSPLSHITVLEEAHNLLKRTPMTSSSEQSNLIGKSVEMLANSIAEMRTYGEGFVIADQSPGLLDMSVIRNTNTKIILRLPDKSDRELVGYAAGLNVEQIDELSKLKKGVAAIYQNDWVEPVLVQVNKCEIKEEPFQYEVSNELFDKSRLRMQLINFLIQGRLNEKLEFSISEIEKAPDILSLSSYNRDFIEEQILEYREKNTLSLWEDSNFKKLSRRVTDILELREKVERIVKIASHNEELTELISEVITKNIPDVSQEQTLVLLQCLMRDMSIHPQEREIREKIYCSWMDFMTRGEKRL